MIYLSPAPSCPPPPQVNNADISTLETESVFIIGSQANYTCTVGYILQGDYFLRCGIQGGLTGWPDSPTCFGENAYSCGFTYFTSLW